ncbi:hypothetical protein EJ03DRAFT_165501 [Teratosphaeria nubilosa]|uniref:Uncharacterized protein n=1 Tax=Teratosphaeria nubilosa TaxID=161662 RepID=A0A6G1L3S3_9PEZI|nr:hypothetical protein EJ03DRAFT_165501 [Teratosphaeria nubilosa]
MSTLCPTTQLLHIHHEAYTKTMSTLPDEDQHYPPTTTSHNAKNDERHAPHFFIKPTALRSGDAISDSTDLTLATGLASAMNQSIDSLPWPAPFMGTVSDVEMARGRVVDVIDHGTGCEGFWDGDEEEVLVRVVWCWTASLRLVGRGICILSCCWLSCWWIDGLWTGLCSWLRLSGSVLIIETGVEL